MSTQDALAAAMEDFDTAEREVREWMEATPRFSAYPEHRAQAFATLVEARAQAYAMVVAAREENPRLYGQCSWHGTVNSLGTICPDFRYAIVPLDGRRTYRLQGRLGDVLVGLWQVRSHVLGHPDSTEIGNYDITEMAEADGTFDIVMSADEHPRPWIRLDGGSEQNFVLVRRILAAITDDHGDWHIVDVDGSEAPSEIDPDHVARRLHRAADFLRYLIRDWAIGLYDLYLGRAGAKNCFTYIPGHQVAQDIMSSPSNSYGFCVYELAPAQALVLEWEPVESAYWSWQVGDVWSNSLDFINYQSDVNMRSAVRDADGTVRAVVCATDPGVPNWLDTRGRREGVIIFRNYKERSPSSSPRARLVQLADLRRELPTDTPEVTAQQRAAVLQARRRSYRDAYGD